MEIKQNAIAGTLESSDIQITIAPEANGINIELQSDVAKRYGNAIKATIQNVLDAYEIKNANVRAVDKGALDMVIKARTITAVERAIGDVESPLLEVL